MRRSPTLILPVERSVNVNVASALFRFLSEPQVLLGLRSREDVLKYISDHAGEPAEQVIARFAPPRAFATAASPEPLS